MNKFLWIAVKLCLLATVVWKQVNQSVELTTK